MGILKYLLVPLLAIGSMLLIDYIPNTDVHIDENGYFGTGKPRPDDVQVRPFRVSVEEKVIQDLKQRLQNSRITHDSLEDSNDFYYGFNSHQLRKIKDYWLTKYDWRKWEQIINSFTQFTTQVEGLRIHFIRQKPPANTYKQVKPLLIAHGWPGNVFEFYKFIPILTDPKRHGIQSEVAFEVIAPSIPGYGWSEQPKKTGFSQLACARVFKKLMLRLGFQKFFVQGGDWGALITPLMARMYPQHVQGLHVNTMFTMPGDNVAATLMDIIGSFFPSMVFSGEVAKDHNMLSKLKDLIIESGYMHLQATKPDTIGAALNDSPLGLAAYILEKFSTWTNTQNRALQDGGLNRKFTNDELLTIVMIYWVNGNIASSQRFYREHFTDQTIRTLSRQYCSIPTGHASGLNEFFDRTPVEMSKQLYNITHYTEIEMGHFGAFEQPKQLAQSVFIFVNELI